MFSSSKYWEERYHRGGNSGVGSYNKFAQFKAEFVNGLVLENKVNTVVEFGVGDGNQLSCLDVPSYTGLDVSHTAIKKCREMFANDTNKSFHHINEFQSEQKFDLALSMDVIYHLVEDDVFVKYMNDLFNASSNLVCIYASNTYSNLEHKVVAHIKHRKFTDWVEKNQPKASLIIHRKNKYPFNGDYKTSSFSDFYVFKKTQ